MFENKKIFILGMARSGYEAAKVLLKRNNEVFITDSKDQDEENVKELISLGCKYLVTENPDEYLDDTYDYLIKNPGIKKDHKCVSKARDLNIKVINEIEMAYHLLPKNIKIIGITGSNGKTTTTTLVYEILKGANLSVHLGGNIGYPLSSLVDKVKGNDILLLEISDHQLCDMYDFKTDISVFTNVSPTHLDFHNSYDEYKQMKMRIFNHHTNSDIAILNKGNDEVIELTKNIPSIKRYFTSKNETAECYLKNDAIYYGEKSFKLSDIRVKGTHNYENIMCAILVVKEFNVSDEIIEDVLNKFNGVEHRNEYVDEINGITFYNDSKSTNNVATKTALSSYTAPIILIMGGLNRGQSYDDLLDYMINVKTIICYGETKEILKNYFSEKGFECVVVDTISEATKEAYKKAIKGDIILLSPAHASWDQYKCFEDRGNDFKNIVKEIKRLS